jgi:hypothetical protein
MGAVVKLGARQSVSSLANGQTRVAFASNSIGYGNASTAITKNAGMRYEFYRLGVAAGRTPMLVGSTYQGDSDFPYRGCFCVPSATVDGGITSAIIPNLQTYGSPEVIICSQLVTNNVSGAESAATCSTKVQTFLDAINARLPMTRVILDDMIPRTDGLQSVYDTYNGLVAGIVAARSSWCSIAVVSTAVTVGMMEASGVHPANDVAYQTMAPIHFAAAAPFLNKF